MAKKIHTTPDKSFEYGYVHSPKEIAGRMEPFRPHWWVQRQSDGYYDILDTRREVFQWIAEEYDVTDSPHPTWLKKELSK